MEILIQTSLPAIKIYELEQTETEKNNETFYQI